MRIKHLQITTLAVLLIVVSACRKDRVQEVVNVGSKEVKFSSTISGQITTKAVNDTWEANDAIGVFMKTGTGLTNALAANKSYSTNGDGTFAASTTDQTIYYPETGSVDFIAYYPYKSTLSGNTYPVTVANQSSQSTIDLLYANNATGLSKTSTVANLVFAHQLSKVEITVKNGQGVADLNGLSAKISGLKTTASFDLATGTLSGQGQVADITAKTNVSNGTTVVEAIVLPTTDETGTKIVFALGTKTFTWTLPATIKFEQGKKYSYQVELKGEAASNSGVTAVLNATITNWTSTPSESYSLSQEKPTTGTPVQSSYMETPQFSTDANTMYVFHKSPNNASVRNYALLYDKQYKMAYWVAYPLHASYIGGSGRTDAWQYDPAIPESAQVNLSSSFGNGFDRGHQIPSGDRTATRELNQTTFYYSNMTAQVSSMNQGIWNNLEQQVRTWMAKGDTMYVVTGAAIRTASDATITYSKGSAIPKYYYKALALKKGNDYYTIGFKINNEVISSATTYNNYRVTVSDLERETGYTFFPKLSAQAKTTIDNTIWN
jgi:endonuclease G, mitochondrial